MARMRAENRCFHCGIVGHMQQNCTRYNRSAPPPRNLRLLNYPQTQGYEAYSNGSPYSYPEPTTNDTYPYCAPENEPAYTSASPGTAEPSRNPFNIHSPNDTNPISESRELSDLPSIRKVITNLPAKQFNELFDSLETKDFQ